MATVLLITGFVLLVMETVVGMVANGFIVLINFIGWFRSRKLSPNDLILTWLGLARLAGLAVMILDVTILSFFLCTYTLIEVRLAVTIMWLFTSTINLWFAACLGVWYLMKIAIFSHPAFLQAKQRASQLVPWLLLGSIVFSAFITIIIIITHIRHLQHSGIGVRDLNTIVHLSAIKALASFAVLYLSSFVAITLQAMLPWRGHDNIWTSVLFQTMRALYPSGHAVILILINPKLKKAWLEHLKLGSREGDEISRIPASF
uniref:taste receptor type 2 member 8-like n=1 Tax=Euleptes europaea TaxID=460621 RepID=UPI00254067FD|nr:taste receptor type 2 member 8-like [Euleptes europaea]